MPSLAGSYMMDDLHGNYFEFFFSDNVERREIEKERLQHELRESDDKLNRQVEGEM